MSTLSVFDDGVSREILKSALSLTIETSHTPGTHPTDVCVCVVCEILNSRPPELSPETYPVR